MKDVTNGISAVEVAVTPESTRMISELPVNLSPGQSGKTQSAGDSGRCSTNVTAITFRGCRLAPSSRVVVNLRQRTEVSHGRSGI